MQHTKVVAALGVEVVVKHNPDEVAVGVHHFVCEGYHYTDII